MKTVIFACVNNAGRSQIAAAIFQAAADPQKARAVSAGTNPGPHVHPIVITAMLELAIDLTSAKPQLLTEQLARKADLLITMGCGDNCPFVAGLRRDDWPLQDPRDLPLEYVRTIRDDIALRVRELLSREGWAR